MNAPTRPVLRWHGGKWRLAPWILSHFPPHRIYVEPFGGAASVLLRKPPCFAEYYNDLDQEVVNLFGVLRDRDLASRLIAVLELTPFARAEFEGSYEESDEPVERARRLIVRCFLGYGSDGANSTVVTGFRAQSPLSGRSPEKDWRHFPPALALAVDRFKDVVVECRPAVAVMARHDSARTLHYCDPPYLAYLRSTKTARGRQQHGYAHEMTDVEHAELLVFLQTLTGMVVLSGYPSALYDDALSDWRREESAALADGARKRTEVLWINPAAAEALDRVKRGDSTPLFAGAA